MLAAVLTILRRGCVGGKIELPVCLTPTLSRTLYIFALLLCLAIVQLGNAAEINEVAENAPQESSHDVNSDFIGQEEVPASFDLGLLDQLEPIFVTRNDQADIVLDGQVTESTWLDLPGFDLMRRIDPDTLELAPLKTLTRIFHTNSGLYVSAVMEQPRESLVSRLSSRDQQVNRDSYSFTLDTFG